MITEAVVFMIVLSFVLGLILVISSKIFAVKKDEKLGKVLKILPGVNCSACGFTSCEAYAKAVLKDKSLIGLCKVGGKKVEDKLKKIL